MPEFTPPMSSAEEPLAGLAKEPEAEAQPPAGKSETLLFQRATLCKFYELVDPSKKASDVDSILDKRRGEAPEMPEADFQLLCAKLNLKYKIDPFTLKPTNTPVAAAVAPGTVSKKEQRKQKKAAKKSAVRARAPASTRSDGAQGCRTCADFNVRKAGGSVLKKELKLRCDECGQKRGTGVKPGTQRDLLHDQELSEFEEAMDHWMAGSAEQLADEADGALTQQMVKQQLAAAGSESLAAAGDATQQRGRLQAEYFGTKFHRRARLCYDILSDLRCELPEGAEAARVASFGGGPGADAAGLLWARRELWPEATVECTLFDAELTWKKYQNSLQLLVGGEVQLGFQPCDVTLPLSSPRNRKVVPAELAKLDLLLFFYICHETAPPPPDAAAAAAETEGLAFYKELAGHAKLGATVVLADVSRRSETDLQQVAMAMSTGCTEELSLVALPVRKKHNAHVAAFRFEARKKKGVVATAASAQAQAGRE
jgi:hypothetical protein